jgi:hypothetical protein
MATETTNTQLLNKVLEIVGVMGEVREQLNGFVQKCAETDQTTAKTIDDLQKRMGVLEVEGTKIVRELIKDESEKVDFQITRINTIEADVKELQKGGSKITRELIKEEASKLSCNVQAVDNLSKDVAKIKEDVSALKTDAKIETWKTSVIVSFVSVVVTLVATYVVTQILHIIF